MTNLIPILSHNQLSECYEKYKHRYKPISVPIYRDCDCTHDTECKYCEDIRSLIIQRKKYYSSDLKYEGSVHYTLMWIEICEYYCNTKIYPVKFPYFALEQSYKGIYVDIYERPETDWCSCYLSKNCCFTCKRRNRIRMSKRSLPNYILERFHNKSIGYGKINVDAIPKVVLNYNIWKFRQMIELE